MSQVAEIGSETDHGTLKVTVRLPGGGERVLTIRDEEDLAKALQLEPPEGGFPDIVSACLSAGLSVSEIRDFKGEIVYEGPDEADAAAKPRHRRAKAAVGALIAVFAGWMALRSPAPPADPFEQDPGKIAMVIQPMAPSAPPAMTRLELPPEETYQPVRQAAAPAFVPPAVSEPAVQIFAAVPPPPPMPLPNLPAVSPVMASAAPILDAEGFCLTPELLAWGASATR